MFSDQLQRLQQLRADEKEILRLVWVNNDLISFIDTLKQANNSLCTIVVKMYGGGSMNRVAGLSEIKFERVFQDPDHQLALGEDAVFNANVAFYGRKPEAIAAISLDACIIAIDPVNAKATKAQRQELKDMFTHLKNNPHASPHRCGLQALPR